MNELRAIFLTLGLATVAALPSAAAPQAVGQLLNVTGRVEVQRAGQPVRKGTLLFQLQPGDLLVVREGGVAEVVLFKNGARFSLPGDSAARVEPLALQPRSGPAPKPLKGLSLVFVRQMNTVYKPPSTRILGVLVRSADEDGLGPCQPSPSGAVRDAAETLHWVGPIEGQQLRLRISDGRRTVCRADLPPAAREFKVPPSTLKPGVQYVWSVTTVADGESGHECRAPLRVLLPRERTEVEAMERETAAARRQDANDPAPLLLIAQVYERLGLRDDARAAYQAAQRLRPDDEGVRAALARLSVKG